MRNFRHWHLFLFDYYALSWRFSRFLLFALSKPRHPHQKHTSNTDHKGSLYDVYSPVYFWWTRRESNPRPEHLLTTFNEFYIYIISGIVIIVNVFLQVCQILFFSLNKQLGTFILYCNGNYDLIDWFAGSFFKHFCICRSLHKVIFNV